MTETNASSPAPNAPPPEPPRVIGPWGAFSIVAGSMIGVGIFIFTPNIAKSMGGTFGFFAMLLLGGLFAIAGSVACGELGTMMPRAGGDYVFQRQAFGRSMAFGSGWVLFGPIFAGSVASLAVAVFEYDIGPLIHVDLKQAVLGPITGAQLAAVALIVVLTLINDLGTALSAKTQTILTLAPILALVVLALVVLARGTTSAPTDLPADATLTLGGFATAFLVTNFIFSGWINIVYVAGEVKDPNKNIPRSMLSATGAVTALYILLGITFIAALGIGGLANTYEAGTATAEAVGGGVFKTIVLLAITVAIVTSINGTILAAGRVGFAMGADGAFLKSVGVLSGVRKTPRRALWIQAVIAAIIVLTGTVSAISQMASVAMLVTGTLTVLSLFVLRRRQPDVARPYRATFYPWLPALYVALALFAIGIKLYEAVTGVQIDPSISSEEFSPWYPLLGVGVLMVAWLGHLLYLRRWKSAALLSVGVALGMVGLRGLGPTQVARAADNIEIQAPAHDEPASAQGTRR